MDKDTLLGKVEKTVGQAKEVAGRVTGNNEVQAEGATDQAKGQLHETVGAIKDIGKEIKAGGEDGTRRARETS